MFKEPNLDSYVFLNFLLQCQCNSGFTLGPDGRTCTDSVLSPCYAMYRNGQCNNPSVGMVSKSTCCCNSGMEVKGWGMPCQACPFQGKKVLACTMYVCNGLPLPHDH